MRCSYLHSAIVSIHAPTRGATVVDGVSGVDISVSIHAPTRGATFSFCPIEQSSGFQSTHPHGVRRYYTFGIGKMHWFQSTHPHGVRRHEPQSMGLRVTRFQSTHPHGVRHQHMRMIPVQAVSIHAPTRGATRLDHLINPSYAVSIHAPTRGATFPSMPDYALPSVSIHAPTRGATFSRRSNSSLISVSIHAPTRGATSLARRKTTSYRMFQSTHPHGVRQCAKLHIISQ